jgi:hypothetical protein
MGKLRYRFSEPLYVPEAIFTTNFLLQNLTNCIDRSFVGVFGKVLRKNKTGYSCPQETCRILHIGSKPSREKPTSAFQLVVST